MNYTDYSRLRFDSRYLIEVSEETAATIFRTRLFYPEDGGSIFLRNVGNVLPDYKLSRLRRL
jgi:hypothetical protein